MDYTGVLAVGPQDRTLGIALSTWPNPSPGGGDIHYSIATRQRVTIGVFDVQGRQVRALVNGAMPPGPHLARWDGRTSAGQSAPAGVYFARLETEGRRFESRFVMLR